jgi:repressor LexA
MKAIERVLKIIDYQGLNNSSFEKKISVSNGYIAKQMNRNADLGEGVLLKILENSPDINPEWLLTGKGPMLKVPKNVIDEIVSSPENKRKSIPMLPFDAFAGFGDANKAGIKFDEIEERYDVPLFYNLKVDFMINVRGSSMYPKYSSGDVVACRMVNELLFIQWNKIYVIDSISQGIIMKRLKKSDKEGAVICKSDNTEYYPFEIPLSDIRKIALVVGSIRLE